MKDIFKEHLKPIIKIRNYKMVTIPNQQVHFIWSMMHKYF